MSKRLQGWEHLLNRLNPCLASCNVDGGGMSHDFLKPKDLDAFIDLGRIIRDVLESGAPLTEV